MTILVGILVALFTIGAAGFGITALLVRQRVSVWESAALSWFLGTASVSLMLWILGFVLRGWALQIGVAAVCVMLGALGVTRWRSFSGAGQRFVFVRIDNLLAALFCLELLAIVHLSFHHTLGWDGLLVWELKARYAFLNGGALPADYFQDVTRRFSHPEYPLFLPLTETWFYLWIGDFTQFWIKLLFPLWYAAGMSMLWFAARELSGNRWIAWSLVLIFPFIPSVHGAPGGIQSGYADMPLGMIFLGTIFYLQRFLRAGSRDSLMLCVALGAILPWVKREGAILWAVTMLCALFAIWNRRNLRSALFSLLPGIGLIAAWKTFESNVHVLRPPDFLPVSEEFFLANFKRISGIGHELYLELCDTSRWNIFWALVVLAILSILVRERTVRGFVLILLLVVPLACYCASYIFSTWPSYIAHIEQSLPRLLIQLVPIGWLLIALALRSTPSRPAQLAPPPGGQSEPGTDCN